MKNKYDTLILNRLYIPIHIVSWKRSINLLYQNIARSLDRDMIPHEFDSWVELGNTAEFDETYYHFVHSVSKRIAIPDILVLRECSEIPRRDIKYTRENLFQRDEYRCCYCNKKYKTIDLTVDHVIPKSKGGDNSWKNMVTSCKRCNNIKSNRTPQEAKMKLFYKPTEPIWTDTLSKHAAHPNLRPSWEPFMKVIRIG